MSVRDDLCAVIWAALYDDRADCPGVSAYNAATVADAVLAYLGGLDPDCSAELLVWHCKNDRAEFVRLLRELTGSMDA